VLRRLLTIPLLLLLAVTIAHAQPGGPGTRPLFNDEFTSLSLHNVWQRGDKWQLVAPDTPAGRGGVRFGESGDHWWTNPFNLTTPVPGGPPPAPLYQIDGNGLKLALLPAPPGVQSYIRSQCRCTNLKYIGALLNSSQSFLRRFGYVEMQVAVDRLPGFTFQADEEAQPISPRWPPEIDFPLIYTDASGVQWMKIIVNERGGKTHTYARSSNDGFDASTMHTYGVNWQVNFITFYVDGARVFQVPTPTDDTYTNHSMYWYLLTGANYQQPSAIDPDPSKLPVYAHMRYFRAYAELPFRPDVARQRK
jgi:serralysin